MGIDSVNKKRPAGKLPEITISVKTQYVPDQSDVSAPRYVFVYTITIHNTGEVLATLATRHWIITEGPEKVREVRGLGVVGEQPVLKPGESFEDTSGTIIATAVGSMRGSYGMIAEDGTFF